MSPREVSYTNEAFVSTAKCRGEASKTTLDLLQYLGRQGAVTIERDHGVWVVSCEESEERSSDLAVAVELCYSSVCEKEV